MLRLWFLKMLCHFGWRYIVSFHVEDIFRIDTNIWLVWFSFDMLIFFQFLEQLSILWWSIPSFLRFEFLLFLLYLYSDLTILIQLLIDLFNNNVSLGR
jgi:hypothetical protein